MGFLAPGFLLGALAVGVPLYLHLLRRNTSTPLPFSSLMFFERRPQTAVQRRRLRYWLLLALRLAVLLLLALAFAEPYLSRAIAGVAPEKLLLIVIDDSFSMRAGMRLQAARRQALELLEQRRSADRAQVIALGAQAHVLTQASRDARDLREAVESIQAGDSRASFGTLATVIRSIADNERVPVDVHLYSDLQKTAMPPSFAEMALPEKVTLRIHDVAGTPTPNWTVESVAAPRQVWDPRTVHIQAVVAGYGTPAATRTVSFIVNGKTVSTQRVSVPPSGRATVELNSLDLPFGLSRGTVKIDGADTLAADDEYLFVTERADRKRGLFVYQTADTRSPLYFGHALTSAAQSSVTLDKVTVDRIAEVDPTQYAFVVVCDVESLPAAFADRLLQYVRRGGSVLVALGTVAGQQRQIPLFGGNIISLHHYSRDAERFTGVGEANTTYPAAGSAEEWEGVRFFYAAAVDENGARVEVRLQDRTPLLLEKALGEGRVLLFTSGFDNLTNDLPLRPVFVAFVDRAVRYLSGGEVGSSSQRVDDLLQLRTAREDAAVGVEVIDPSGRRGLSLQESASARSYPLSRTGFYALRLANGRQDLVAANPDRRESDLTPIPAEVLALWRGGSPGASPGSSAAAPVTEPASAAAVPPSGTMRNSLWWYAISLLLVLALAESAVGSGYLGTLRDEP
jgi:Aerotolerance regulator N-terminal/von Willebrand factor type A domain